MILQKLITQQVLVPGGNMPKWLADNCAYLTIAGSMSYGVSTDNSDMDVVGFAVPPKEDVFPHLAGYVQGFGPQPNRFDVWQQHHIKTPDGKQEYDFAVYTIVKYLALVAENNPNMIDSLFTRREYVLHASEIGNMLRERRKKFLHKGAWHKFKGYAYGQVAKIKSKRIDNPLVEAVREFEFELQIDHKAVTYDVLMAEARARASGVYGTGDGPLALLTDGDLAEYRGLYEAMLAKSKRTEMIKRHGFDVKFAYHVVRLMNEVEQILIEGDLDLVKNNAELIAIRRGDWTVEQIIERFEQKEKGLETVYEQSKLPHKPDWDYLTQTLLDCLETHYGTLEKAISRNKSVHQLAREMRDLADHYDPPSTRDRQRRVRRYPVLRRL